MWESVLEAVKETVGEIVAEEVKRIITQSNYTTKEP